MKGKSLFMRNIPNFLSIARIMLAFVVIYLIFTEARIWTIIIIFSIAAITDFFDGVLARRYGWISEFGRRADMIADRFLWAGTTLAFIISFGILGELRWIHGIQLFLIMSREIISFPYAIIAFFSGRALPKARYIAKVTTFLQGFALPLIILCVKYPLIALVSFPIAIATSITGFISALHYIEDTRIKEEENERRKR